MKSYKQLSTMIHINNYGTDFMFSGRGVCNIFIYSIVSHNFQFPFSFQDTILVG